jgi:sulfur carrier protein ThiS
MKVTYRDQELNYETVPTRNKILADLDLNPLSVLFIDKATGTLLPPTKAIKDDMHLEVRAVISGGSRD